MKKQSSEQQFSSSSSSTSAIRERQARGHGHGHVDSEEIGQIEEVEVTTALGRSLKKLLIADTHSTYLTTSAAHNSGGRISSVTTGMGIGGKASGIGVGAQVDHSPCCSSSNSKPLLRTIYEFEVHPVSEKDVPVVVIKSKVEARHQRYQDSYVHCSLSSDVCSQLDALYKYGKLMTSKQRKKRELKEFGSCRLNGAMTAMDATSSVIQPLVGTVDQGGPSNHRPLSSASTSGGGGGGGGVGIAAMKPPSLYDSIYDDDVVVGRYVPLGALEMGDDEGNRPIVSTSSSNQHPSSSISHTHPHISIAEMLMSDGGHGKGKDIVEQYQVVSQSKEDLMKPVQALLQAQAVKEYTQKQKQLQQMTTTMGGIKVDMVIGKDAKGQQLVHRDIFASTHDKIVKGSTIVESGRKAGDIFGTGGVYDYFPEKLGSYEVIGKNEWMDD